ncbi:hypothetical protein [uncultured Tateyamaria sp.]|uniref:hypothetical protein n=1 Tax=uncultured Tateyamaria sp. TaxID=455651 RepID=UPI00260DE635|nr:hypothetical protein [uncultured Tateyamaria sp.]
MPERAEHLTQLGNAIFDAIEIELERQENLQIDLTCMEIAKILIEIAHAHMSFDMMSDEELSEYGCVDGQKLN